MNKRFKLLITAVVAATILAASITGLSYYRVGDDPCRNFWNQPRVAGIDYVCYMPPGYFKERGFPIAYISFSTLSAKNFVADFIIWEFVCLAIAIPIYKYVQRRNI